jgi:exopolyphosphatase/guanosine-5'-triphosphate,3'-diphosphate pyrophosphatase
VEFAELPRGDQRTVTILSAMLRLAEGLDRSHAQSVTGLTLTTRQSAKVIRLQTRGDAELELWAAHRHAAALADCLDAEIVFDLPMPRRRARPRIRRKAARRK